MKKVDKEILKLAIPNILSNISIPLLSTVDTLLMGGLSIRHLAAIGIGSMIFNMIYWNFGFLRMGTTGMTAQAYGAHSQSAISNTLGRGVLLGILLAIIIMVCSPALLKACYYLFNVEEGARELVKTYYTIRIWAAPATLSIYVLSGWLFGMQNAIYPLIVTIIVNVVNILLSYYGVAVLHMDIAGVAWGTVVAQYTGALTLLIMIATKYKETLRQISKSKVFAFVELLGYLRINADIFLRTVCLTFAFSFFYSQSFKLGAMVLAVNVILQQFINWMSYGIDGFAYATESIVGKYKGAENKDEMLTSLKRSFVWGGGVAVVFTLVFVIWGRPLMTYFSDDAQAISLAYTLERYIWVFPILAFPSYIWDGVFVGLVASRSMRDTMILALGVFLLCYYLLPTSHDGAHIWLALLVFMVARGGFQTFYFWKKGFALK